jgi:hypothetical protein
VVYNTKVVKGLYREMRWEMAEQGQQERYLSDRAKDNNAGEMTSWKNIVRRSWNTLLDVGGTSIGEEVREFVVAELDELDKIFQTHFGKESKAFMTSTPEWKDIWGMYVKAVERYAEELAQRSGGNASTMRLREQMESKVKFVLTDNGELHLAPPFPLITRSVVPMLRQALKEVSGALYEVSCMCMLLKPSQVECIRPASVSMT